MRKWTRVLQEHQLCIARVWNPNRVSRMDLAKQQLMFFGRDVLIRSEHVELNSL